jgi:hypothetical protein
MPYAQAETQAWVNQMNQGKSPWELTADYWHSPEGYAMAQGFKPSDESLAAEWAAKTGKAAGQNPAHYEGGTWSYYGPSSGSDAQSGTWVYGGGSLNDAGREWMASQRKPEAAAPAGGGGGGTTPTDGLFNNIAQPTAGGEVLDPQMSEVAPPPMPNVARQGLLSASGASTGWNAQPVSQMDTKDIGKRIYPPGGTALTQRGRVF